MVFSATVSPVTGTGKVGFSDGSTVLGTVNLTSGSASFSTALLSVGVHSITATYLGDAQFNSSSSPALSQTISRSSED